MKNNKPTYKFLNYPVRLPINSTVLLWFLLFYFHAPGWLMGVMGLATVIIWAFTLSIKANEKIVRLDGELLEELLRERAEAKKSSL